MRAAFLALGLLAAAASAAARAGPVEVLAFGSFTPQDYAEIINGSYRQSPVELQGHLSRPDNAAASVPAVVIIPGSGGYAQWMQDTVAEPLNRIGIATLIVDSFAGRGVKETARDQGRVPMAASVLDGFQALALLARQPGIDARRIGITGFSRGGVAALFTAERRLADALPGQPRFAAHLPFYPGCSTQWDNPRPSAAPLLLLLGARDDYTPAANCLGYAVRLRVAGADIRTRLYDSAGHAWMADYPARRSNVQTFGECDLRIEDDGQIRDAKSGASSREGWKEFAARVMASCGGIGATVGADAEARVAATADMLDFFRRTLLRQP
ncbi:dienelactone hydrolase family protein [Ferrovibrio sp. MS7]|uniref:dienelactone hydrolase family protein n=1 Tax=Ferrovibrio plantarum TaxID=3119164 RepID=UPI003136DFA3